MKFISNNNITDPTLNLAMENMFLRIFHLRKVISYSILIDLQLS